MTAEVIAYAHQMVTYAVVSFVVHLILTMIVIVLLIQTKDSMKEIQQIREATADYRKFLEDKQSTFIDLQKAIDQMRMQLEEKEYEYIALQNKYVTQKKIYERYLNHKLKEIKENAERNKETDNGSGSCIESAGEQSVQIDDTEPADIR